MLQIRTATTNKLYIKCKDLITVAAPIYLFRFYNELSKVESLIEMSNESIANPRFDLFTLILPTDLDLKDGVYLWEVYQSETPGDENYSNMPLLSNGTAKVITDFTENASYTPEGTDTVYNG